MNSKLTRYISREEIRIRVRELAEQITRDYTGGSLTVIGILKGSYVFVADLIRELNLPLEVDFLSVATFGEAFEQGGIRIRKDISCDVAGKDVLIVEDILDTGKTLTAVAGILRGRGANSLKICALLDKPTRRTTNVPVEYVGFTVPEDCYLVGYGIDHEERYRNLPYIAQLHETQE